MSGDNWETPDELYEVLNEEFNFSFDAACTTINSKCPVGNYSDLGMDALEAPWHKASGAIWLNPPYSRKNINYFMEKAYMESMLTDNPVVCLCRCDPTAKWFKEWVDDKAYEVRLLMRRIKFKDADASYPFPCCVVIYNRHQITRTVVTKYYLWDWK